MKNENNSLTVEQVAPYLPYKLRARLSHEGIFNLDSEYPNEHANKIGYVESWNIGAKEIGGVLRVADNYSFDFCEISEIELVLRQLSDLIKEIEHDGEKFVPIIRIFNAENQGYEFRYDIKGLINSMKRTIIYGTHKDIEKEEIIGYLSHNHKNLFYSHFEKLVSWHFDVFGLIDQGLAVDINTL